MEGPTQHLRSLQAISLSENVEWIPTLVKKIGTLSNLFKIPHELTQKIRDLKKNP